MSGVLHGVLMMRPSVVAGSVVFDGNGDYLRVSPNSVFSFGTGDFTVEAWVRLNTLMQTSTIVSNYGSGSASEWELQYRADAGNAFVWGHGDSQILVRAYSNTNTWVHVAVSRQSSTTRMFFNGTQQGASVTNTNDLTNTNNLNIGSLTGFVQFFNGYVSNLRVVKGTAVYTSNFTVPSSPLTAISGTSLLTCQSPTTITDASANNFTVALNGQAAANSLNPF